MPRPREGSVIWNKKRKAWVARLDWTDDDGREKCRKRQVENKSAGNILVKKWIRDLEEQGAAYLDAEAITFEQLADKYKEVRLVAPEYRDGRKVKGLRDWKGQRFRLGRLVERFGRRRIRSITFADIEKYRNDLISMPVIHWKKDGTAAKTRERSIGDVHRMLALLRAVFTYAVQSEWLIRNPFTKGQGLISMAQEVARERVLSTDEQRKLLEACKNTDRRHIYPIILTALDSGCRRGELLKMKWADVDLNRGALTVMAMNAKTNRPRVIDLEPITLTELRRLARESGGFPDQLVFGLKSNFNRSWRTAMKEAKITGARFHDLRATAITTWLLRGLPMPFAMARSGHADPRTFMRYVRMVEEIREKQREQLREWELAASLTELAANGDGFSSADIQVERLEFIN
ncbi:MAG TPA: tyrosine-type recombinase/integrase [Blastocatellia bacterium]|jgi:integrase|nr:tyrosine-type recombinase/integrase [Blastocatellia bacterium]